MTISSDIIELAIFEIDEKLRNIGGRDVLTRDEATDMFLDVRQTLDRYYITMRSRTEVVS